MLYYTPSGAAGPSLSNEFEKGMPPPPLAAERRRREDGAVAGNRARLVPLGRDTFKTRVKASLEELRCWPALHGSTGQGRVLDNQRWLRQGLTMPPCMYVCRDGRPRRAAAASSRQGMRLEGAREATWAAQHAANTCRDDGTTGQCRLVCRHGPRERQGVWVDRARGTHGCRVHGVDAHMHRARVAGSETPGRVAWRHRYHERSM